MFLRHLVGCFVLSDTFIKHFPECRHQPFYRSGYNCENLLKYCTLRRKDFLNNKIKRNLGSVWKNQLWFVLDKRLPENHFSLQLAITSLNGGKVTHNGEDNQGRGKHKEHGTENDAGGSVLLVLLNQNIVGQHSCFGSFFVGDDCQQFFSNVVQWKPPTRALCALRTAQFQTIQLSKRDVKKGDSGMGNYRDNLPQQQQPRCNSKSPLPEGTK